MRRQPCILGDPHQRGTKSEVAAYSGAQKRAEMPCHPCILGDPQRQAWGAKSEVVPNKGEQNQKWLPHPFRAGNKIRSGQQMARKF